MTGKFNEVDLSRVKTVSIGERSSRVSVDSFGKPLKGGKTFARWLKSLPDHLAVRDWKELLLAMRRSVAGKENEIIWMIGAHVIKCGLSPYLIELMKKRYVTAVAMNGAGLIHDTEIACFGETSEDVPASLHEGIFGFASETADACFEAVKQGVNDGLGLGETLGRYLLKKRSDHWNMSILAQAYRMDVPVTVHVAVGTDILHQHEGFDGAAWGALSHRDFRIFSDRVQKIGNSGGVVLNVGSAVILPEVFLKAFSIARNLGASFDKLTTCNLDMIRHYRPQENVLARPASFGGKAISITGHHEIMIPLLYASLLT